MGTLGRRASPPHHLGIDPGPTSQPSPVLPSKLRIHEGRLQFLGDLLDLTEHDLLLWQKTGYVVGAVNDHGRFIPGEACKWRAGASLMMRMEEATERYVGVAREVGSVGKEEEKSILYGCKSEEEVQVEEKEEGESILCGYTLGSRIW